MRFEILLIDTGGRGDGKLATACQSFSGRGYVKIFHMKASKIFFIGFVICVTGIDDEVSTSALSSITI